MYSGLNFDLLNSTLMNGSFLLGGYYLLLLMLNGCVRRIGCNEYSLDPRVNYSCNSSLTSSSPKIIPVPTLKEKSGWNMDRKPPRIMGHLTSRVPADCWAGAAGCEWVIAGYAVNVLRTDEAKQGEQPQIFSVIRGFGLSKRRRQQRRRSQLIR